jgi:hypothetical protein
LGKTKMAFIGNPRDTTVNYATARAGWSKTFRKNMVSNDLRTDGALPPHASPQWNPFIYRPIVQTLQDELFPLPGAAGRVAAY